MKRILALILIFIMTISFVTIAVDENYTLKESEVELITRLNIINADMLKNRDEIITRGELVSMVVKLMGLTGAAENYQGFQPFFDVDMTDPYYGYIAVAANMGIISGYQDGFFYSEDEATFAQAIKMAVAAIGLNNVAIASGGFPYGYYNIANRYNILRNLKLGFSDNLPRGAAVVVMFNLLRANAPEMSFGGDSTEYEQGSKSVLERNFDIKTMEGIVTATPFERISEGSIPNGKIEIGGIWFSITDDNVMELLGQKAVIYYTGETEAEYKAFYIHPKEDANNVFVLPVSMIDGYSTDSKRYEYGLNEYGKLRYANLAQNAVFIYNGTPLLSFELSLLIPKTGDIRLVDNNDDDYFDYVIINSYKTIIVNTNNITEKFIIDRFTNTKISTDETAVKTFVIRNTTGQTMSVSDIKQNDILSVSEGTDSTNIIVSRNLITGTPDEIIDDPKGVKILLADNYYELGQYYFDTNQPEVSATLFGTFYIDAFDKIVAVERKTDSTKRIGFIITGEKSKSADGDYKVRLLDSSGDVEIKTVKPKAVIDGVKCESADDVEDRLSKTVLDSSYNLVSKGINPTVIIYNEDTGGQITQIETPYEKNAGGELIKPRVLVEGVTAPHVSDKKDDGLYKSFIPVSPTNPRYKPSQKTFEGKGLLADNLIIFNIPRGASDEVSPDEEDKEYTVSSISALINEVRYANFEIYKTSLDSFAGEIMVMYNSPGVVTFSNNQAISLVTGIKRAVNIDGIAISKIDVIQGGREATYNTNSVDVTANISVGDAVRFVYDKQGDVAEVRVVYDRVKNILIETTPEFTNEFRVVFGGVYSLNQSAITIAGLDVLPTITDGDAIETHLVDRYTVYYFDKEQRKFRSGSKADIIDYIHDDLAYSKVLIYTNYGDPRVLVIY